MTKAQQEAKLLNKLLLTSACKGTCCGWIFLAVLLIANVGGMGDVILKSSSVFLAVPLLMVGFAITFGSAGMGHAVMSIPAKDPVTSKEDD